MNILNDLMNDLLYDLEERSVKLGEYLIAVFKLKTNIVGLHPSYVLNKKRGGRKSVRKQFTMIFMKGVKMK